MLQHGFLAACYAWLGDKTAAAAHVGRMRELDATLDQERFLATMHFAREQDMQHLRERLQYTGL
jgi:adenylate cyclase